MISFAVLLFVLCSKLLILFSFPEVTLLSYGTNLLFLAL